MYFNNNPQANDPNRSSEFPRTNISSNVYPLSHQHSFMQPHQGQPQQFYTNRPFNQRMHNVHHSHNQHIQHQHRIDFQQNYYDPMGDNLMVAETCTVMSSPTFAYGHGHSQMLPSVRQMPYGSQVRDQEQSTSSSLPYMYHHEMEQPQQPYFASSQPINYAYSPSELNIFSDTNMKKKSPFEEEEDEEQQEEEYSEKSEPLQQIETRQSEREGVVKSAAPDKIIKTKSRRKQNLIDDQTKRQQESIAPENSSSIMAQPTQRIGSTEGWRRMNGWLKNAIKQSDNFKLKQLLTQMISADINVSLLRDEHVDTPKLVKNLQKSEDKGIAAMAANLVDQWKQKVRNDKKGSQISARKISPRSICDANKPVTISPATSASAMATTTPAISTGPKSKNEDDQMKEKAKTAVRAKIRLSKPRLTGLEGDDTKEDADAEKSKATTEKAKRPGPLSTTPAGQSGKVTPSISPISESPLTKILAATNKFHAQSAQPKRKPIEVMFSDNFMDSLAGTSSSVEVTPAKKSKIIRKKLSSSTIKPELKRDSLETSEASARSSTEKVGRRVRFCDEIGVNLVQFKYFDVEEGERVNVTKMNLSKDEIKHLDSQREKLMLQRHQHSFGSFSLTDPTLMPPGHFPQFQRQYPPQPQWVGTLGKAGRESTHFPWRLLPVDDVVCLIVPGNKSQTKNIELTRQKEVMEAISLPEISLPISDIDKTEYNAHRNELIDHVPKIIPLEMVSESIDQPELKEENSIGISEDKLKTEEKGADELRITEEPKELKDEEMDEDERMEEDQYSPEPPAVHKIDEDDEEEEEAALKKMDIDSLKIEQNIASPEPDHNIASPESEQMEETTVEKITSIKEIPTEVMFEEEKEDLDIRELNFAANEAQPSEPLNISTSDIIPTSLPTGIGDLSKVQAFLRKGGVTPSLLQRLSNMVGSTSSAQADQQIPSINAEISPRKDENSSLTPTKPENEQGPIDQQKTDRMPTPATLTQSNAQPAAIDTPFQRLPHPFMTSPMRGTAGRFPIPPVHLLMNAAGGRIPFPPPNFSTPPPNFSALPSTMPPNRFSPPQFRPINANNDTPTKANPQALPPPGLLQTTPSLTDQSTQPAPISGHEGKAPSPGPPGLDEGGSPPQAPEQQEQQQRKQVLDPTEARAVVGLCQFFVRTKSCRFGEKCKYSHGDDTITLGVQLAMRGVNIAGRGGPRGRGNRGGIIGRGGFRAMTGAQNPEESNDGKCGRGFEGDRRHNRRGSSRYDISPVRSGGDSSSMHERRYRSSPSRRHRRHNPRPRSRSRDRRSGRRRSRSRDRRRRSRSRQRRRRRSSSSSSSSTRTYSSRSPTPSNKSDKRKREERKDKEEKIRSSSDSSSSSSSSDNEATKREKPASGKESSSEEPKKEIEAAPAVMEQNEETSASIELIE